MSTEPVKREPLVAELEGTPYNFGRRLASGAMGEVLIVEHRDLGQRRVMKLLRSHLAGLEDLATRLRTEARLLTQLVHPNLVQVLDFGRTSLGRPFLVMELLEGETLKEAVRRRGPMPPVEALGVVKQMLEGLAVVHRAGIVHRDVKPDNAFYCFSDTGRRPVKLLDFGVAKVLHEHQRQNLGHVAPTAEGMLVGTPSFLAPEQALGQPVDARADLYAMGCVLFYLLTGRPPFVKPSQLELLQAHALEPAPTPSTTARFRVSDRTDALTLRALAKAPADRYASASAMLDAVAEALALESRTPPALASAPNALVPGLPPGKDEDSLHGTVIRPDLPEDEASTLKEPAALLKTPHAPKAPGSTAPKPPEQARFARSEHSLQHARPKTGLARTLVWPAVGVLLALCTFLGYLVLTGR